MIWRVWFHSTFVSPRELFVKVDVPSFTRWVARATGTFSWCPPECPTQSCPIYEILTPISRRKLIMTLMHTLSDGITRDELRYEVEGIYVIRLCHVLSLRSTQKHWSWSLDIYVIRLCQVLSLRSTQKHWSWSLDIWRCMKLEDRRRSATY